MPQEVFDIEDFTCASPWEKLVAAIEDRLCSLGVDKGQIGQVGPVKRLDVNAGGKACRVELYRCEEDPGGPGDHTIEGEEITKWFSLRQFLILRPYENISKSDAITLLSSISLASFSCECVLPVFVQTRNDWKILLYGKSSGQWPCTWYDVQEYETVPSALRSLTGLVEHFNEMTKGTRSSSTRTLVSTSFRYAILNTRREGWRAAHREDLRAWTEWIGPEDDPLLKLELCASWPFFQEGAIVDNSVYSDLDVMKAPRWILRADWSTESLWFDTPVATATCRLIAQRRISEDKKDEAVSIRTQAVQEAPYVPLTKNAIDIFIAELFEWDVLKPAPRLHTPHVVISDEPCPFLSFLSRFVFKLSFLDGVNSGSTAVLWIELVKGLRKCYETNAAIPHLISEDSPNFKFCLLHQKLQLLQRCIRLRLQRATRLDSALTWLDLDERFVSASVIPPGPEREGWDAQWTDSECATEASDEKESVAASPRPPEGVAGTLPFALLQTGQPANLPIMQEPPVMTKDAFDEREQMFLRLGPSATDLRHDLQAAQLRADMSAFKAANPGCIFEDFIRWYSPRDWSPAEDSPTGTLSARFQNHRNVWRVCWSGSPALASAAQKPLFDFEGEAERILNYLEHLDPDHLLQQLCQIALANCLQVYSYSRSARLSSVKQAIRRATRTPGKLACDQLVALELQCARGVSLLDRVNSSALIDAILSSGQALATSREQRSEIARLLDEEGWPDKHTQEVTLLQPNERNRLYCLISDSVFRQARALTK